MAGEACAPSQPTSRPRLLQLSPPPPLVPGGQLGMASAGLGIPASHPRAGMLTLAPEACRGASRACACGHPAWRVGMEDDARGVLGSVGRAGSPSLKLVTSLGPSTWVWEGSPSFSQAS